MVYKSLLASNKFMHPDSVAASLCSLVNDGYVRKIRSVACDCCGSLSMRYVISSQGKKRIFDEQNVDLGDITGVSEVLQ